MAKISTTFRLEEQQLEQLEMLVELFKEKKANNPMDSTFNVRISRASVLEMLIKQEYVKEFMKMK